jgi:multidrug efflux pump subunit AcrA (membrane-fusion protein)
VRAGAPILRLRADGAGWIVRLSVADRDVVRLRHGDPVAVRMGAYPDRVVAGNVTQIAAAAARATGTFDVEAALAVDGELLSGLPARAEISPVAHALVAIVPIAALLEADGESASLFVVDPARSVARRLMVRVAFLRGSHVALSQGLEGVEEVVTDGAAFLRDGAPVRVVATEVATAP